MEKKYRNFINETLNDIWNELSSKMNEGVYTEEFLKAFHSIVTEKVGVEIATEYLTSLLEANDDDKYTHVGQGTYVKKGDEKKKGAQKFKKDDSGNYKPIESKDTNTEKEKETKIQNDPGFKTQAERDVQSASTSDSSEEGSFNQDKNSESLDSFIKTGFTASEGAPGSAGSMLNEIVSIKSATNPLNSGENFDYDSQLEANIKMLKGTGLANDNASDNPATGVTKSEAKVVADKYGVSIGVASKVIIATRAANSKFNHVRSNIMEVNGLKNTNSVPFFGDKGGLKAQENMINSSNGRVLLGNTEVSKEEAIKIIRSGGGGENPSDTAIFVQDKDSGDVYMTFYSDKDNVNAIVAQSSLKAEGESKKVAVDKLVQSGKLTEAQSKVIKDTIDNATQKHDQIESELNDVTNAPIRHLETQDVSELLSIAKTSSAGADAEKYYKSTIVNQIQGSRPNKLMVAQLPEGHSNPPTDKEMVQAFVKYCNLPESQRGPLTKDQNKVAKLMSDKTNGPAVGAKIGDIRKRSVAVDLEMYDKLNETTYTLDNGTTVGLGTYLEASSISEKLHLKMMFGGDGVYKDPAAFYQESGGVKVDGKTMSKCMPFDDKNDMISHFEVSEERETIKRGTDQITGGAKIVYAISKGGQRVPIAEKKQRSKDGDLGRLSTVYNYHPEIQNCFKSK